MKKIIVVVALIVGCLSCFGAWKEVKSNNTYQLPNRNKTAQIGVWFDLDVDYSYFLFGYIKIDKLRIKGAIEITVDDGKIVLKDGTRWNDQYMKFKMSIEDFARVIGSKKIKVKANGKTFEFVP